LRVERMKICYLGTAYGQEKNYSVKTM
jgi:hypothetical protein